ncbi:MAG: hypothetical protein JWN72_1131 [Thermoleophilia bacterium]|nr:hypothetical protein [Thermoleophilia bacterium]
MDIGGQSNKANHISQPNGVPAFGLPTGGQVAPGPDQAVLELHARLVALVPDAEERAALLRVPTKVDAAWSEGRMLPVLRAQRKSLMAHVARLERAAAN